jgi:antitoxin component YwqK of YwqJK toxin-antitoxin module
MGHLSNSLFVLGIAVILGMNISCSPNASNGVEPVIVDTLGGQYERVILDYHGDTAVKTLQYRQDSLNYFELKYHTNGEKYMEGWVEDGQRTGEWFSWYPNGVLWSYGEYVDGKRNGYSEAYYENGTIRIEQHYYEGVPDKKWIFYTETSEPVLEIVYDQGEKISETRY